MMKVVHQNKDLRGRPQQELHQGTGSTRTRIHIRGLTKRFYYPSWPTFVWR